MSWSITATGTPDEIKDAMEKQAKSYGDPEDLSAKEFAHAREHIAALLDAAKQDARMQVDGAGYAIKNTETGIVTPMSLSLSIKQL